MNSLILGGLLIAGILCVVGAFALGWQEDKKAQSTTTARQPQPEQSVEPIQSTTITIQAEQLQELLAELQALRQQTSQLQNGLQALAERVAASQRPDTEPQSNLLHIEDFTRYDSDIETVELLVAAR